MQAPFVTLFMYLGEAEDDLQLKHDLAMCIEEVLRQRIQGVKNESGNWITPAFPKLIYVTEEDNIHEDSKYYYLTELAAKCTAKRLVPDYISEKVMNKLKGDIYTPMGCVLGDEILIYRYNNEIYYSSIKDFWNRFSQTYGSHLQPGREKDYYCDLRNVEVFDTIENKFVECHRIIRNVSNEWVKIELDDSREFICTIDHPLSTVEGLDKRADELIPNEDELYLSNTQLFEKHHTLSNIENEIVINNAGLQIGREIRKGVSYDFSIIFQYDLETRIKFVRNLVVGYYEEEIEDGIFNPHNVVIKSQYRSIINSLMLIVESIGAKATYSKENDEYVISFNLNQRDYVPFKAKVVKISKFEKEDFSYDVTTSSEHFDISGIWSHNCRSFLTPDRFTDNGIGNIANAMNYIPRKHKYYGRMNLGVVTVNLPYVAMMSNGDEKLFWEKLDEVCELCHRGLQVRIDNLKGTVADVAPISWMYGAIARLKHGETIDKLMYNGYATISLGYAGLYEAVYYLTGESHTNPNKGKEMGLKIMQFLNKKTAEWKAAENIDYSLYGTPIESTTYKFAKALQNDFGIIEEVSDHDYISNSYHCVVREEIDAFKKLEFEAEFQELSPGGAISYVEVPNMNNNLEAVMSIIKYMYDHILYAEINTKSDYCQLCHYDGEIKIVNEGGKLVWECPSCGNRDQRTMNVARRTCGLKFI